MYFFSPNPPFLFFLPYPVKKNTKKYKLSPKGHINESPGLDIVKKKKKQSVGSVVKLCLYFFLPDTVKKR